MPALHDRVYRRTGTAVRRSGRSRSSAVSPVLCHMTVPDLSLPHSPGAEPGANPHGVNLSALLETLYGRLDPSARPHDAAPGRSDWAASAAPMFRVNIPAGAGGSGDGIRYVTRIGGDHTPDPVPMWHPEHCIRRVTRAASPPDAPVRRDFPLPLFQVLHGNPGDYVWGAGGLDHSHHPVTKQFGRQRTAATEPEGDFPHPLCPSVRGRRGEQHAVLRLYGGLPRQRTCPQTALCPPVSPLPVTAN